MLRSWRTRLTNFAPAVGFCALLAALPICAAASSVTEDFTFQIAGINGTGEVTFDPSNALTDTYGPYVDASQGLSEFNLSYNGVSSYDLGNALAAEVFLPGDAYNGPAVPADEYAVFGYWVVPGTLSNGFESLIGVDRHGNAFLLSGVEASSISFAGSGSSLTLQVCPAGDCPNLTVTRGAITPEPGLLPLLLLGLAGLWFARRKAVV